MKLLEKFKQSKEKSAISLNADCTSFKKMETFKD